MRHRNTNKRKKDVEVPERQEERCIFELHIFAFCLAYFGHFICILCPSHGRQLGQGRHLGDGRHLVGGRHLGGGRQLGRGCQLGRR